MNIKFTKAVQSKGTIENNLKPGGRIYKFNAECYRDTRKAILVWRDIWLPKSEIKIVWGDPQIDCVSVSLSVPKWLIKKNQKVFRWEYRYLANIFSFVIQSLTQYVHHTSWPFGNNSRLSMDSRNRKLPMLCIWNEKTPIKQGAMDRFFYLTLSDISAAIDTFQLKGKGRIDMIILGV